MEHKKGFAPLILIVAVLVVGITVYLLIFSEKIKNPIPVANTPRVIQTEPVTNYPAVESTQTTYTNTHFFNFSFIVPQDWVVKESDDTTKNFETISVVPEAQMLDGKTNITEKVAFSIHAFPKTNTFEESIIKYSFVCGVEGCRDPQEEATNLSKHFLPFTINGSKAYRIPSVGCSDDIYVDGKNFILVIGMFDLTADINCTEGASQYLADFANSFVLK